MKYAVFSGILENVSLHIANGTGLKEDIKGWISFTTEKAVWLVNWWWWTLKKMP